MSRAQIIVLTLAAAALAAVAPRMLSRPVVLPGDVPAPLSEDELAPRARIGHPLPGKEPGRAVRAKKGPSGEGDSADGEGGRPPSRGAVVITTGRRGAGGHIGSAVRGAPGGGASGAAIADIPGVPAVSAERRSAIADHLSGRQTERDPADDDRPADEDPDDDKGAAADVVLSLPLDSKAGTVAEDGTTPLVEQDLSYDDEGKGVRFKPQSVLAFPDAGNLRGDAGTISLDLQPTWNGADEGDFSLVNIRTPNEPDNLLRIYKNGKYMRFVFAANTGEETGISVPIDEWAAGERHTVTATWGDELTTFYIDHVLAGQNSYSGQLQIRPGTPLYLGSDVPQAPPTGASATIANFQVYGRALSQEEIAARAQ